jgi:flagellar motor switch protein FliN
VTRLSHALGVPARQHSPTRFPFQELSPEPSGEPGLLSYSDLGQVPFTLEALLGSLEINVQDLLALQPGSVILLDRGTGVSLEIFANGIPIARGEVRLQKMRFALRITEVLGSGPAQDGEAGKVR